MTTIDKTETLNAAVDLLAESFGVELSEGKRKSIAEYLDRNITGTIKPRLRVPKETVEAIRAEYAAMQATGKTSMTTLAKKYGVSLSTVQRYVDGTLRA
jgi:response regulator of citrate/malate metabolism